MLTGDTLFIGDIGRPDLSPSYTPQELAGMLYDSLHHKLMTLPDDVLVYPAHGAGSLCGRNMRAERFSTIGTERLTNYALQIKDRDDFIRQMTSNLPARPEYFLQDAAINRAGATSLGDLPALTPIAACRIEGDARARRSCPRRSSDATSSPPRMCLARSTSRSPDSSPRGRARCWDSTRIRC